MTLNARADQITAAKIETALVFERMLGTPDALAYLRSEAVSEDLIERVLGQGPCRPPLDTEHARDLPPAPPHYVEGFYSNNGRRKDTIKCAVVQAALSLREQLGNERMERMLQREGLPNEVIARVLCGAEGTLRVRVAALAPHP